MSRALFCLVILPTCLLVSGDEPRPPAQQPPETQPAENDPHRETMVAIEVSLVKVKGKSVLSASAELTPEDLADLRRIIEEDGLLVKEMTVRTTALNRVPATMQLGESVPVVSGIVAGPPVAGRGQMTSRPMFQTQSIGTLFEVTPTVLSDGKIALKLQVESSDVVKVKTPLSAGPDAETIEQTGTAQFRTSSTVKVTPGRTTVANATSHVDGDKSEAVYLLVSAEVKP